MTASGFLACTMLSCTGSACTLLRPVRPSAAKAAVNEVTK
jgi:hypothetical protein